MADGLPDRPYLNPRIETLGYAVDPHIALPFFQLIHQMRTPPASGQQARTFISHHRPMHTHQNQINMNKTKQAQKTKSRLYHVFWKVDAGWYETQNRRFGLAHPRNGCTPTGSGMWELFRFKIRPAEYGWKQGCNRVFVGAFPTKKAAAALALFMQKRGKRP
jgi:hypothetical protein